MSEANQLMLPAARAELTAVAKLIAERTASTTAALSVDRRDRRHVLRVSLLERDGRWATLFDLLGAEADELESLLEPHLSAEVWNAPELSALRVRLTTGALRCPGGEVIPRPDEAKFSPEDDVSGVLVRLEALAAKDAPRLPSWSEDTANRRCHAYAIEVALLLRLVDRGLIGV